MMSTMTDEQRAQGREAAHAAMRARGDLTRRLRNREVTAGHVLHRAKQDTTAGKLRALALVRTQPGYGDKRSTELLERLGISPKRRLRGLGARQQAALAEALGSGTV